MTRGCVMTVFALFSATLGRSSLDDCTDGDDGEEPSMSRPRPALCRPPRNRQGAPGVVRRGAMLKRRRGCGLRGEIRAVGPVIVGSDGSRCKSVVRPSSVARRPSFVGCARSRVIIFGFENGVPVPVPIYAVGVETGFWQRHHQKPLTS